MNHYKILSGENVAILLVATFGIIACEQQQSADISKQAQDNSIPSETAMPQKRPANNERTTEQGKPAARQMQPAATTPQAIAVQSENGDLLARAKKSGCLACHKIESKLVGPAWQDVARRYLADATAKSKLIAKVKKGGKGNWTEVTGGAMMPPYSPRVKDEDIEKLVSSILKL